MILKELDPFSSSDRLQRAGRAAEEQMAFYLKRAFAADEQVRVFNNLRLVRGEDAAQIDHLVLHRTGVVIIESKSVTTEVVVNEHGEWARRWGGRLNGMPSPIEQARRQGSFLHNYLRGHVEELLDKVLGVLQKQIGSMTIDVVVAISDYGIIKRPRRLTLDEVCKADQVPAKVKEIIEARRRAAGVFSLARDGGYAFTDRELVRLAAFLRAHHKPLREDVPKTDSPQSVAPQTEVAPASTAPTPPLAIEQALPRSPKRQHACRTCGSGNLVVLWGQYGYYHKCLSCKGNTPIKLACPKCGNKLRLRKAGQRFFADCEVCATSELYYVNPTPMVPSP